MKKNITFLTFLLYLLINIDTQAQKKDEPSGLVPDEVYVKIKDNTSTNLGKNTRVAVSNVPVLERLQKQFEVVSAERSFYFPDTPNHGIVKNARAIASTNRLSKILRVRVAVPSQIDAFINELKKDSTIEYVERIPYVHTLSTPNDLGPDRYPVDGSYADTVGQWHLYKINAPSAWDITTGDSTLIIAVVDAAINTHHPDLKNKLVAGYDATNGSSDPNPPNDDWPYTHGTHVAGIVGAETNNSTGIASIGYNTKVMPVKMFPEATGASSFGYEGIAWAVQHGAKVINCSWGGGYLLDGYSSKDDGGVGFGGGYNIDSFGHEYFSTEPIYYQVPNVIKEVLDNAYINGVTIVAASSNTNQSEFHPLPAAYKSVISVAASDITDTKCNFSDYGSWIDITAPGQNIYSTFTYDTGDKAYNTLIQWYTDTYQNAPPQTLLDSLTNLFLAAQYNAMSGASQASPQVAGTIGLMYSVNESLTQEQCKACLLNGAVNIDIQNPDYAGKLGAGRLDAYNAVVYASNLPSKLASLPSFRTLTTNYSSSQTFMEKNIQASNIISGSNTEVSYQATEAIDLITDFEVESDVSYFEAKINACPYAPSTARKSSSELSKPEAGSIPENIEQENMLLVYPNPVTEDLLLSYNLKDSGNISLSLIDINGKNSIPPLNIYREAGTYNVKVNVKNLPAGTYVVALVTSKEKISKKIVILR